MSYLRNLPVPFFSQRQNDFILKEYYLEDIRNKSTGKIIYNKGDLKREVSMDCRTCNITSLCMLLHYWGLTKETPNQMIE
jgi:hypothetical protein